ncbi:MAG: hypothetical protein JW849_10815 [Phycisphaerae bacterium]|nr:hypothetical protein [Phycisphaerae bacterium]
MSGFYGMFGMIGSAAGAHMRAAEADVKDVRSRDRSEKAQRDYDYLEERLDKLLLICSALWELLRDRTELTEDDLIAKVQEVDLRDGRADGKISKTVKKCPKCGRTMSSRHRQCLYCGAEDLASGAFDAAT